MQVPGFPSAIETRSLPTLTRSYPRHFTFYVAWPTAPFSELRPPASSRSVGADMTLERSEQMPKYLDR
jgi:hypothetical protein